MLFSFLFELPNMQRTQSLAQLTESAAAGEPLWYTWGTPSWPGDFGGGQSLADNGQTHPDPITTHWADAGESINGANRLIWSPLKFNHLRLLLNFGVPRLGAPSSAKLPEKFPTHLRTPSRKQRLTVLDISHALGQDWLFESRPIPKG